MFHLLKQSSQLKMKKVKIIVEYLVQKTIYANGGKEKLVFGFLKRFLVLISKLYLIFCLYLQTIKILKMKILLAFWEIKWNLYTPDGLLYFWLLKIQVSSDIIFSILTKYLSSYIESIALLWRNAKHNVNPGLSYFERCSLACVRLSANLHLHLHFALFRQSKATLPI